MKKWKSINESNRWTHWGIPKLTKNKEKKIKFNAIDQGQSSGKWLVFWNNHAPNDSHSKSFDGHLLVTLDEPIKRSVLDYYNYHAIENLEFNYLN